MADDKASRDKQARDRDRRQQQRAFQEELARMDESEPLDPETIAALETELETLTYPTTGTELIDSLADQEIAIGGEVRSITTLIPDSDTEEFASPAAVRMRVQRPTVAIAMKRIVEASDTLPRTIRRGTPFDAYEKTLTELKSIDAADDDEGIAVVTDWIIEQITVDEQLPGSREVRREAARFCRQNGYQISNNDWLGI